MTGSPLDEIDYEAFARDLDVLRSELVAELSVADAEHMSKMERWGKLCTLAGYATAWIAPNPLSIGLIGQGSVARWTIVAHHVIHKGMDRVPGAPERFRSRSFARGSRRWLDWLDWLVPEAWHHEHDLLHHPHTGELSDPDLVEDSVSDIRASSLPRAIKYALVGYHALTWKLTYYAPSTFDELWRAKIRRASRGAIKAPPTRPLRRLFDLRTERGRAFWASSVLPYGLVRFAAVPSLFALLGPWAAFSVWVNSLGAELYSNAYSFAIIVPNHAGDDLYRYPRPPADRAEFYVRQVAGSANFTTGGDLNDFLHGFLNYQIEHHLWPDLPPAAYQRAQPRVKEICKRHGVPYAQQPVLRRVRKLLEIIVGETSMRQGDTRPRRERSAASGQ